MGAINKQKANTISTVIGAIVQAVGVVVLIVCEGFNIFMVAVIRSVTEFILCLIRVVLVYKNKKLFVRPDLEGENKEIKKEPSC